MKNMGWLLAFVLVSCDADVPQQSRPAQPPPPSAHDEVSSELTEKGKVLEIAFRLGSSTTTTSVTPGYNKTISKSFIDDPIGLHDKKVVVPPTHSSSTVKVEDQFAIVFECQHGKFLIESLGQESVGHMLWKKLKQGDEVTIQYKERYTVFPSGEKKLVKYEFVDANVARAEK